MESRTVVDHGIPSSPESSDRYFFLLRRLHSLTGIIPVGCFLLFHLTVNATILAGPTHYQAAVDQIHLLARVGLLVPVEMATIFVPLFFHAILGVVIILSGSWNVATYGYGSNVRYTLQRITGIIAFAFILVHLWQMHWLGKPFGGGFFVPEPTTGHDPTIAAVSAAKILQESIGWMVVYAVGIVASVYHLANGIWTFLITWGITIGPRSQRLTGYACTAIGIAFGLVGLGALVGFGKLPDAQSSSKHGPAQMAAVAPTRHLDQ